MTLVGVFWKSDRFADELINRIWYAGAYTAQLCTIDPHYGNSLNFFGVIDGSQTIDGSIPWWSNSTIANSSSVLVDGPKRDRLVWPGGNCFSRLAFRH
jgi:hypothetical protein